MHNRVVLQLNTIHYIIIIKTCIMHELLSLLSLLLLFRRYHYFCFCLYTAINLSKEIGFQEGISEAVELSIGNIATLEKTGDVQGAFRLAVSLKTIAFKVRYMCAHGPCGFRFPQHGRVLFSHVMEILLNIYTLSYFQRAKAHVGRLRDILKRIFREVCIRHCKFKKGPLSNPQHYFLYIYIYLTVTRVIYNPIAKDWTGNYFKNARHF